MEIQVVQNGSLWSLLSPLGERSSQANAASERAERLTRQNAAPMEPDGAIMELPGVQNGSVWSLLSPLGERSSQASAASERAKRLTLQEGELRV